MEDIHNIHLGERAFVLGCGPSLAEEKALPRLAPEITFATSRLKNWAALPLSPTYQLLSELPHIQHHGDYEFPGCKLRFLLSETILNIAGWRWLPKHRDKYLSEYGFKGLSETFEPFTNGRSSVLHAVQVLCWMGVAKVYLLGCDLTFRGYAWDSAELRQAHGFERHALPFKLAHVAMGAVGRELVDCTRAGKLQGWIPQTTLEEVL